MKLIMGIERPTAGRGGFRGRGHRRLAAHKIARKGVGMVFQHSRPLHRQTVLENIMVALLPDSLFMLFPIRQGADRARQKWIAEPRRPRRRDGPPPADLPFADLRRLEWPRRSRAIPRWCWSTNRSPA
jgi:branched-chain amino acid transport system ATP-binding protein